MDAPQVYQGAEPIGQGKVQYCYRLSTFIQGSPGLSIRLRAVVNILTSDVKNDKKTYYEPGERSVILDMQFTGSSSLPNTGLRLASNPPSSSISESEARDFVLLWLNLGSSPDIEGTLALYTNPVNYYQAGVVTTSFIRKDKIDYAKRWSQRNYTLTSNIKTITVSNSSRMVQFDYDYVVVKPNKTASGRAYSILKLLRLNGKILISQEQGRVY